jgi:hypothetical protein
MYALVPIGINIVIAGLLGAAGALECNRLLKRHADLRMENALVRAPYLWVLIPLCLLLLLANVAAIVVRIMRPALYWGFPLWLDYSIMQIQWCILTGIFAFTFGFSSVLAWRTAHRERHKVVIASVLLVAAIQIMQWNYTRPVTEKLKDDISPAGMVSQTSPVSCAAASGATILRTFGQPRTEREVASFYGTSMLGTSAAQIIYGNTRLGIVSRKVDVQDRDPSRLATPAMIFIDNPFAGPESHAVAFLGMKQGRAAVWDPISGLILYDARQLAAVWKGHGIEFDKPGRQ